MEARLSGLSLLFDLNTAFMASSELLPLVRASVSLVPFLTRRRISQDHISPSNPTQVVDLVSFLPALHQFTLLLLLGLKHKLDGTRGTGSISARRRSAC